MPDQGDAIAQYNLANLHLRGQGGLPQDAGQAAFWFRKAADLRNAEAMNYLGVLDDRGDGVPADRAEAMRWYKMAAAAGLERGADNARLLAAANRTPSGGGQSYAPSPSSMFPNAAQQYNINQQRAPGNTCGRRPLQGQRLQLNRPPTPPWTAQQEVSRCETTFSMRSSSPRNGSAPSRPAYCLSAPRRSLARIQIDGRFRISHINLSPNVFASRERRAEGAS